MFRKTETHIKKILDKNVSKKTTPYVILQIMVAQQRVNLSQKEVMEIPVLSLSSYKISSILNHCMKPLCGLKALVRF